MSDKLLGNGKRRYFPIAAEKRRCLPLTTLAATINSANGRKRHLTSTERHTGGLLPVKRVIREQTGSSTSPRWRQISRVIYQSAFAAIERRVSALNSH